MHAMKGKKSTLLIMCYNKYRQTASSSTPRNKDAMELYIETLDIPIVAEFAYLNSIRRAALYEIAELSYTLGKLIEEGTLEKGGL